MVADEQVRRWLRPALAVLADALTRAGLRPGHLTATGLALGVAAAVTVALGLWWAALVLWLVSRLADGVDGVMARRSGRSSELGGFLDLLADFLAYGAWVVGVAVALPGARVACAALLLAYYLNGSAFLALSGLAERRARRIVDTDRSLQFVGGLAEGVETVVAHAAMAVVGALAPQRVVVVVWVFTAVVAVTVVQRVVAAVRLLRDP